MKNWEHRLARALDRRWVLYRKALRRCQRRFSEGSIHASRIEARRMAAQLDLLRGFAPRRVFTKAHRTIKRHLNTFDSLRDAQVQLAMLQRECRAVQGARGVRKLIIKRETRCRKDAARRIKKLKTRHLNTAVKLLIERLEVRGRDREWMRLDLKTMIRTVDIAFRGLQECRRHMNAEDVATIHRTRIAFKRFRYMMESMCLVLPGITASRLAMMKELQSVLGDLQDTDVFLSHLDKFIRKKRLDADELAPFRRWLIRRRARQAARCIRRAAVMSRFWPLKSVGKETK